MPDYLDENWGHWVFVFDHGRFAITQENETSCTWGYGSYAVNGSRTAWTFKDGGGIAPNTATNRPGEYFVFDVSTYRDTLTLTPVRGSDLATQLPRPAMASARPDCIDRTLQHPLPSTRGCAQPLTDGSAGIDRGESGWRDCRGRCVPRDRE